MKSQFIKEQKRYTQKELCELMECSTGDIVSMIRRLKEFGIIKMVRVSDLQKDMSELQESDIEVTRVSENDNDFLYVFTFVGVIAVAGRILKCYPKYILKDKKPTEHLKQVMKVLQKYNSKKQIVRMFNENCEIKTFNLLAVLLFLMNDYFENGSYINTTNIAETNGAGEIIWDKTVNETFAVLSQNRPYYTQLQTQKRITNNYDYFKRLHECVVSMASRELKDADLLDIFEISEINISDENLDEFGEPEYILYRIENELNLQFNTRKQMVLKTLSAYISNGGCLTDTDCFSMFGTNSFHQVWEDICADIFNNKLDSLLGTLDLPVPLCKEYDPNIKLKNLIEKPYWSATEKEAKDTLIPDLISIYKSNVTYGFFIFDAKYYVPALNKGEIPASQPGIESVTKQYLYQLAYQQFVQKHKFQTIRNCFLLPAEGEEIIDKGYVSMPMLDGLGLQKIYVRLIPADMAYSSYLASKKINVEDLKLN